MIGTTRLGNARWVTPLCWAAVLLDGFDLVVLGTVIPVLVGDGVFGITDAGATTLATTGLLGMTIGAMTIGTVTDYLGRRKVMIFAVIVFSVFTIAVAFSSSVFTFALYRFLAGLGLGGCLPTAITLVTEFARKGKTSSAATTVMTGYHVGAVLTALLGLLVLGNGHGWEWMFVIGGIPGLVLAPLMIKHLPESQVFLEQKAHEQTPQGRAAGSANPVADLFRDGLARPTLAFWATSFLGLVLVYGMNTWLPRLMETAGYELEVGLGLLLILNVGAIIGLIVAGQVANRIGVRVAALTWFAVSAVLLVLLSIKMPAIPLYIAVLATGTFVFSSQVLIYAYVGQVYPARSRATGLGWTAGVGRTGAIVGPLAIGALLAGDRGYPWGFYVFGGVAAVAVVMVLVVGRPRDVVDEEIAESGTIAHPS
ncbi:MAG TPA: aromatic acid/H+ symport family MFS transporter, partial [Mycobacterium sp.]|nr:aromatic acid/H+ symport family MFS transporter [Mycobacterium sp.]